MTGPGTFTGIALGGPLAGQTFTHDAPVWHVAVAPPLAPVSYKPDAGDLSAPVEITDFTYVYRTGVRTTHGLGADFWVPKEHAEDPQWWMRELVGGYREGVARLDAPSNFRQRELAEGIAHERKRAGVTA